MPFGKSLTDLLVWIHTEEADPSEKGDERTVYGMDMFKTLCQSVRASTGAFRFQANRKLKDGEVLTISRDGPEVLHIPGTRGEHCLISPG